MRKCIKDIDRAQLVRFFMSINTPFKHIFKAV